MSGLVQILNALCNIFLNSSYFVTVTKFVAPSFYTDIFYPKLILHTFRYEKKLIVVENSDY